MPCRINHRRAWTARMILEAALHEHPCFFITLTYDQKHLPSDGSLRPRDFQLFFKRLRGLLDYGSLPTFRYFGVGEYGDRSFRPHYHAIIFGFSGDTTLFADAWTLGLVDVGDASPQSIAYVAGYTTKKMTKKDDPRLLRNGKNLHPEFIRMSRRPGIGYYAARALAAQLNSRAGVNHLFEIKGAFREIRFGGKRFPVDRYMRSLVLNMSGHSSDRLALDAHCANLNSILDKGSPSLIEARKRGAAVRSEFQQSLTKGRKLL